jgi:hypothetical protein
MSVQRRRLGFWGAFLVYGLGLFCAIGSLAVRSWGSLLMTVVVSVSVGASMGAFALYLRRRDKHRAGLDDPPSA